MESPSLTAPKAHIRIQITKNTKGYQAETTCTLDFDLDDGFDHRAQFATLLRDADGLARAEIAMRETADEAV